MAKTNFTKVEDALTAQLIKMNIDQLGHLADISQKVGRPEVKKMLEKASEQARKTATMRKAIIYVLKKGLKEIKKSDFVDKLKISPDNLKQMIERSSTLTEEEWKKLTDIKNAMEAIKREQIAKDPESGDEQIVSKERKKHINKRFNVKEKWLPL
jgi:hypothetical protein